ncbi:MAG: AraC family ligand binding domain-containing protein, partial [Spirochaetales bacterium]
MPEFDIVANYGTFPPDWSIGVLYSGREKCAPGHCWEGVRDHHVLHLILEGEGRAKWGRRTRRLSAGQLFLIRPGERIFYQADSAHPWSYAWIGFAGVHADSMTRLLPDDERAPCLSTQDVSGAEAYFVRIAQTLETSRAHSAYRAAGLLLLLLAQLEEEREAQAGRRTSASDLAQEARSFIDQNYQREIDVAAVTRHIG